MQCDLFYGYSSNNVTATDLMTHICSLAEEDGFTINKGLDNEASGNIEIERQNRDAFVGVYDLTPDATMDRHYSNNNVVWECSQGMECRGERNIILYNKCRCKAEDLFWFVRPRGMQVYYGNDDLPAQAKGLYVEYIKPLLDGGVKVDPIKRQELEERIKSGIIHLKREFDHVNHKQLMASASAICMDTIERDMPFNYNAAAELIRINLRQAKNGEIEDMSHTTRDIQRHMQEIYADHIALMALSHKSTDWMRLELDNDIDRASRYGSLLCNIDGFWTKSLAELESMKTKHDERMDASAARLGFPRK